MIKINEIIKVKQLPIIEEKLKNLSEEIDKKVEVATSLVCTNETVKDVKKTRAELSKEFKELETKRKEVKEAVMKPYNDFDEIYKKYISNKFKEADNTLKNKIDTVEAELKKEKGIQVAEYFVEYAKSKDLDWLANGNYYGLANINITLSASMKSLKEQAKSFVDRIVDDINLINSQDDIDEILIEYKKDLNVARSITEVKERHIALEKAKEEKENKKEEKLTDEMMLDKINNLSAPTEEVEEEILEMNFKVRGTLKQLKEIKEFLIKGGYDYE